NSDHGAFHLGNDENRTGSCIGELISKATASRLNPKGDSLKSPCLKCGHLGRQETTAKCTSSDSSMHGRGHLHVPSILINELTLKDLCNCPHPYGICLTNSHAKKYTASGIEFPGLRSRPLTMPQSSTMHDLALTMHDLGALNSPGGISGIDHQL